MIQQTNISSIGSTIFYQPKRASVVAKLSLIALMDIFTILVFFLLLNSGEAEKIQNAKFVSLPDSNVGTSPHKEVAIIVDGEKLWFEDALVGEVGYFTAEYSGKAIPELSALLADYTERYVSEKGELNSFEKHAGMSITILGDKSTSYTLIRSIMESCQENNLRNISLAVNQTVKGSYEYASEELAANASRLGR